MVFFESGNHSTVGFLLAKGIALVYLVAFMIFYRQFSSLVGEKGLAPIGQARSDKNFLEFFSIFYLVPRDWAINLAALFGILLSVIQLGPIPLGQNFSILIWLTLWILFISFINAGQVFTKPGWELILSEAGFLAIFLVTPGFNVPELLIFLFRWVLFRMMFGSAIVKLRGGDGWKSFDSLSHHFESQPFPGPLSWNIHNLSDKTLKLATFSIQSLLLVVPFLYFLPQPFAAIGGLITLVIQIAIALSGNYAWLNLVTSVLVISTFNDSIIESFLSLSVNPVAAYPYPELVFFTAVGIVLYSIEPILNFFSRRPLQNASFNPFDIANSYGAFPRVMEDHYELIIEGKDQDGGWKEYRLHSSFADPEKRPIQIAPYHYMMEYVLDFYLHGNLEEKDWIETLMYKLLREEEEALKLVAETPFKESSPNKIRAVKYKYSFTSSDERKRTGKYWKRQRVQILKEIGPKI